jgi:hypothetical protein
MHLARQPGALALDDRDAFRLGKLCLDMRLAIEEVAHGRPSNGAQRIERRESDDPLKGLPVCAAEIQ